MNFTVESYFRSGTKFVVRADTGSYVGFFPAERVVISCAKHFFAREDAEKYAEACRTAYATTSKNA